MQYDLLKQNYDGLITRDKKNLVACIVPNLIL